MEYFEDEQDGGERHGREANEREARRIVRLANSDLERAERDAAKSGLPLLEQLAVTITDEERLGYARRLVERKRMAEREAAGEDVFAVPAEVTK